MLAFLVLLVVGAAVAQTMPPAPKPCCGHRQFTAELSTNSGKKVNGQGVATQSYQNLTVDYDAKMLFTMITIMDVSTNTATSYKVMQDYNTMKQYVTLEDGTCFYQMMTEALPDPCIPANATFLGVLNLGLTPSTLKGNAWEIVTPKANTKMVVTQDTCTPIMEASYGMVYGEEQVLTTVFSDYVPSIADRSNLMVPANCDRTMPTESPDGPSCWTLTTSPH